MVDPRHHKRPESVMVVVYTDDAVLIIKRADHQCFWQSVTGSLEWGELAEDTAKRELEEETGIVGYDIRYTGIRRTYDILEEWQYKFAPGTTRNEENLFLCKLPEKLPITIDPNEHTEYEWVPYDEAIERVYSWTNKLAIKML
ncbi:MAG: dihydroneopterin triphosphate diphosphatase [Arenicella sp.]